MIKNQPLERVVSNSLLRCGVVLSDQLVVAVSGGVDSMTLLLILRKLGAKTVVVHINHRLRKTAARDEKAVIDYSAKLGIPSRVIRLDLGKAKTGIEERAREMRYKALREVASDLGAKYILTAHTADDQVETVVFNFLRGAGLRGLAGMREASDGILRPFLGVTKDRITAYAKKHRIPYHLDETNLSYDFTRNRIRLDLLPKLVSYNSNINEQILSTAKIMLSADQAISDWANLLLSRMARIEKDKIILSGSKWRELDQFMKAEVLKAAMRKVGADLVGLKLAHFEEAVRFVANLTGKPARKRIGGKLWLGRGYDKITVTK